MIFGSLSKCLEKLVKIFATKLKSESNCDDIFSNFLFSKIWSGQFYRVKLYCNRIFPYYSLLFSFWQNLAQNEKLLGSLSVLGEASPKTALV
jgi:hypothetical protein